MSTIRISYSKSIEVHKDLATGSQSQWMALWVPHILLLVGNLAEKLDNTLPYYNLNRGSGLVPPLPSFTTPPLPPPPTLNSQHHKKYFTVLLTCTTDFFLYMYRSLIHVHTEPKSISQYHTTQYLPFFPWPFLLLLMAAPFSSTLLTNSFSLTLSNQTLTMCFFKRCITTVEVMSWEGVRQKAGLIMNLWLPSVNVFPTRRVPSTRLVVCHG